MTRIILPTGGCELTSLPGCAQVVVSHNAFILPALRGKGSGDRAHLLRLQLMRDMAYDYALCTVRMGNDAQETILKRHDWEELAKFKSSYTDNWVTLYGKNLT